MNEQIKVLVVDDEENFRLVISNELSREGITVETCSDGAEALAAIRSFRPEVILVDLQMPGMDGLSLLGELNRLDDCPEAIVITGHSTVNSAVEAMKLGAADYITKPFDLEELVVIIRKTYDKYMLKRQNRMLKAELGGRQETGTVIGDSPVIKQLWDVIERVGPTDLATLVQGESGSGKELVSRDRKSTRLNSSHIPLSRMPSSA